MYVYLKTYIGRADIGREGMGWRLGVHGRGMGWSRTWAEHGRNVPHRRGMGRAGRERTTTHPPAQ